MFISELYLSLILYKELYCEDIRCRTESSEVGIMFFQCAIEIMHTSHLNHVSPVSYTTNGLLLSAPHLLDYFDPWKSNGKIPKYYGNHPVGLSLAVIIHSIFTLYTLCVFQLHSELWY